MQGHRVGSRNVTAVAAQKLSQRVAQPLASLIINAELTQNVRYKAPQLFHIAGHQRYWRDLVIEDDSSMRAVAAGKGYCLHPFSLFQRCTEPG